MNLRTNPSANAKILRQTLIDTVVEKIKWVNSWLYMMGADENKGYIYKSQLVGE